MRHLLTSALCGIALWATPIIAIAQSDTSTVAARWAEDPTQVFDAAEIDLDALIWIARPLVVFAQSPNDPQFHQQMEFLTGGAADLAERDVIVITDTDPAANSTVRQRLRPRGFMLALIGKAGDVAFRKPAPWDVREITRSIDKMPMRQQEVEERRALGQ
jgi:hypothetical protein